ncbi:MAG TPA: pitrilysin family protein [Candidatus Dormibacteraeota bacterium]|jgi:predicted Zn-dependent peptidase|nr:pitrilysin family protein [Candidatus Dormibacteraeota bacterium]
MPSSTKSSSGHTLEVLDNGARLVTAPMRERNSASLALLYRVGSRYERPEQAGISHFVEHMLFKGSAGYPTSKEVAEAIEGVGGDLNAATDKEMTLYYAKVPGEKLELAVDVLCDIVQTPKLEAEEFDKEREVIIEELRMYLDSPADHVHTVFEEVLWPGHPLGVDIAGTEESLRGIDVSAMRGYLESHYRAPALVVTVAGNVDHRRFTELLAPRLSGWPVGEPAGFAASTPAPAEPNVKLLAKDTEQAHIVLGTRCVSYFHPDRYILDIANGILGEGMSSRLFLEVRERRGLCYDVHSWAGKLADSGSAGVYVGTEPKKAEEAVRAVVEELRKLCDEPVGEAELTKAKEYYKGRLLLYLESTSSMASWLGSQLLLTGEIVEPAEILTVVDAITAEDVRRVARETYAEQALQLAAIGPFKSEDGLRALLDWN